MSLELHHISKSFPGVKALADVSVHFEPGEVHALCGENGAGKSTLMNIITGNLWPDSGRIMLSDSEVDIRSPQHAFDLGISIVYQHLSLCENLTVAENIFINRQPVDRWGLIRYEALNSQTRQLLARLNIRVKPEDKVSGLTAADRQLVEIAKALARNPSILILDEPTASLSEEQAQNLFGIIRDLKQQHVLIIYISHRLNEVFSIADKISVLKDGNFQGTFRTVEVTREELIRKMVGRDLLQIEKQRRLKTETVLEVKGLSGKGFHDISFTLAKGEILGLAGLAGAGRTEIARALFGAHDSTGVVTVNGELHRPSHPANSVSMGIAYVPEERKAYGLFPAMSVSENIHAADSARRGAQLFHEQAQADIAEDWRKQLRIVTPDIRQKVNRLSGGNQQKVMLARWLLTAPDILIVDEPTHGIDIGAKYEIYALLQKLAAEGKAILLISSELPELLALCDRIIVLKQGTINGIFSQAEATEEKIMACAT